MFIGANTEADFETQPHLFETMVFGGTNDGRMSKSRTWEDAEQQHKLVCAEIASEPS